VLRTKVLGCLTATVLLTGLVTSAQTSPAADEPKGNPADQFVVGPSEVLVPIGVFLLVRKGRKIGAIRFTSIEQDSTVGTGKATYESYFQGDGSGSFRSSNVRKQTGDNDLKPPERYRTPGLPSWEGQNPGWRLVVPFLVSGRSEYVALQRLAEGLWLRVRAHICAEHQGAGYDG
jgi:hypothetical protein